MNEEDNNVTMKEINEQYLLLEESKNDDLKKYNIIRQMSARQIEEFLKNYKKPEKDFQNTNGSNEDLKKEAVLKIENYYLKYKLKKKIQERLDKWENISIGRKNVLFNKLMENLEEQSWDTSKHKSIRTLQIIKYRNEKINRNVRKGAERIEVINQLANNLSYKLKNLQLKIDKYNIK
uniref:Pre-mRNA-splicing factor n=1 Tax=Strongyloides stercoralis TaxID=6248 RepID=A0A0K0ENN8_STRER